jgi:hypothetical protein
MRAQVGGSLNSPRPCGKIFMARSARGYAGSQAWLGFHDDMFPQDTDNGEDWSFLAGFRRSGRVDNWKKAAIGGEMVPRRASSRWRSASSIRGPVDLRSALPASCRLTGAGLCCRR